MSKDDLIERVRELVESSTLNDWVVVGGIKEALKEYDFELLRKKESYARRYHGDAKLF
jgi:hypothetical protein